MFASFAEVVADPYKRLRNWKQNAGKKIIGCFPMYVPEEIIHAAGMLPIIVVESEEPVTRADQYLPVYTCHIVRGTFDLGLRGEMDFVDGFVFADICEPVQIIADTWHIHRPAHFHHNLPVPMNLSIPRGKKYLIEQYQNFKGALEKSFGVQISEKAISQSIAVYNRNRTLMNDLYAFRRANPGAIRAMDMATVVAAGMLMPKEEHSVLVEKLLAALKKTPKPSDERVKLVLSGCFCDMPDSGLLKLFNELDAVVIDDDLYFGSRYFTRLVNESLPPMEALTEHYIHDVPCPTKYNPANMWADYLLDVAKRAKADAVVILNLKYCEPIAHDYPHLKAKLAEAGIPEILIELDGETPLGQIRTRLQALIELVGER
ncbi:MAG: 2-hydroxyacyl-CoA dehydratase family protein [Dehalococcoidia bacterium]|nr:2-hydroxyacyl-CoA dehydratase family protein [Dehalococcoidia bacterium]